MKSTRFIIVVLVLSVLLVAVSSIVSAHGNTLHTYEIVKVGGKVVVEDFTRCVEREDMQLWCYDLVSKDDNDPAVIFRAIKYRVIK